MLLHADLNQRAAVHAPALDWTASPLPGVERRLLHRVGAEVAQATSIVRYAPGSQFSAHAHGGGEEYLVLDGVFQDEHGDYPVGSYVRNPPGTRHTPSSAQGATIFVKLWQFDPQDRRQVRMCFEQLAPQSDRDRPGVKVSSLYQDANEDVRVETWPAHAVVTLDLPQGGEFLVLRGGFAEGGEAFAAQSWLRLPARSRLLAEAGAEGAQVWAKLGHLKHLAQLALPGTA